MNRLTKLFFNECKNCTADHSDLAYVTLVYEAKLGVWAEGMLGLGADERTAKPKYHKKGRVLRFSDAWDDTGREYFRTLVKEYTVSGGCGFHERVGRALA